MSRTFVKQVGEVDGEGNQLYTQTDTDSIDSNATVEDKQAEKTALLARKTEITDEATAKTDAIDARITEVDAEIVAMQAL